MTPVSPVSPMPTVPYGCLVVIHLFSIARYLIYFTKTFTSSPSRKLQTSMPTVPILMSTPMPAFLVRHVRQRVEGDLIVHPKQMVSEWY
jgi:hypothetical protein